VVAFIAQSFFITQIAVLSNGKLIFIIPLALLSLTALGGGIGQIVNTAQRGTTSGVGSEESKIFAGISITPTALCDIMITGTLCYVVSYRRSGVTSTDKMMDSLMTIAIARGALTSGAAVMILILFFVFPDTELFALFLFPTTQFYIFSVVGSLNLRKHLRNNNIRSAAWTESSGHFRSLPIAFGKAGSATVIDPTEDHGHKDLELQKMQRNKGAEHRVHPLPLNGGITVKSTTITATDLTTKEDDKSFGRQTASDEYGV